jgi:hypothetical protein
MDSNLRSAAARRGARLAALAVCAGALAWPAPADADGTQTVTYVESVDCLADRCEPRHRTVPLRSTVRETVAGGLCVEYARRIVTILTYPTRDPATRLEVPEYEFGPVRQVACERAPRRAVLAKSAGSELR